MPQRDVTAALPISAELEVAGPWDSANELGNYDTQRSPIDRIILHTMVGTAESAAKRFDDLKSNVSAHYGVQLNGALIHWLEEKYTAYHAGDLIVNRRSIGIEHEDNGDYNGVRTDALYTTSAKLVADICAFYHIPCDRAHILGHREVHNTACPDALDVERIVKDAAAILNPPLPTPSPPLNPPPPITLPDLPPGQPLPPTPSALTPLELSELRANNYASAVIQIATYLNVPVSLELEQTISDCKKAIDNLKNSSGGLPVSPPLGSGTPPFDVPVSQGNTQTPSPQPKPLTLIPGNNFFSHFLNWLLFGKGGKN